MRGFRLTLLAALVVAAVQGSAAASPARPARGAVLHAVQDVTGTGTASRGIVTLDRDLPLPGDSSCPLSASASFTGTAAQAAVVLTRLPLTPDSHTVWIVHVTLSGHARTYDSECLSHSVPRGDYLLQLVHTSGTSRVRLHLKGLSGSGRVQLRGPDRSVATELPRVTPAPTNPATAAWGDRRVLASRGSVLTLGVIAAGLSNRGADTQGDCLVSGTATGLPDAVAFAPTCPAGGSGLSYGFTGRETWQATMTSNLTAGQYGAGYWFVGTPTHAPWGAVSFWLTNLGR